MIINEAELAWPGGDTPGELHYDHEIPEKYANVIFQALKKFPQSSTLANNPRIFTYKRPEGIVGRYLVSQEDGHVFVRVSSRLGAPALERDITSYLNDRGVPVNRILYSDLLEYQGDKYRLDIRPFLRGDHYDGSSDNLLQLSITLKKAHSALLSFPRAECVLESAKQRFQQLANINRLIAEAINKDTFRIFAEQFEWAQCHRDWLSDMVENFNPNFHELPGAQSLHGEVHPGNVIFTGSKAILLDFEESVHVFAPPDFDLAYLIQRFCMQDDPDINILGKRLRIVEKGYGATPPRIMNTMRQLAWLSIAVILNLRVNYSIITPVSEYEKFVRLEQQAKYYGGLL